MRKPTGVREQPAPAVRVRPRVVVVAQASPAQGGIATFAETLVEDEGLRSSFDLRLLNTTRRAVRKGGTASVSNAWHAVADAVRVFRAARRAEVVHVQTALLPTLPLLRALALCRAAWLGRAAVLCHVHTGLANASAVESFVPTRAQRFLLRRFGFVRAVLAVSEAGANGLRAFMAGARIELVDNAVEVSSFRPARPAASPPKILFVGTLARRKGVVDLAEALELLEQRGVSEWELEVAGSGNEAGDQEAEVVRAGLRSAGLERSMVGPLAGAELRRRLESAAIYALPSHTEGQPIGIIEAMASGLAIVATRVGGIPDMLRHGRDGLLVDPRSPADLADALQRLIESPDLRQSLGTSARRRAEERYDLPTLRARISELYRSAGEG